MNTTDIQSSIIRSVLAAVDSKLEKADVELEGEGSIPSTSEESGSPPQYEEGSFLRPITTDALNSRYCNDGIVEIVSLTIEPGVASLMPPQYLPEDWNVHFHPEGARYYVNRALKVVTDSDIRDEEIYKLLSKAIAYFGKMAQALETPLPENSEICIRVVMEDEPYCGYYIVDHDTRSEFWLQPAESDDLGFYRVTSETHLLLALEGHYWTHVEYFPHRSVPEPVRQEFIACLRHGQLDHLTSLSSTFPYTVEECEKFITVMAVSEQQARNPYLTSMIGRLMGNITRVRFQAFYGENHARLDRDSYRLYEPKSAPSWLLWIASTLVFRMDEAVVEELNGAFPDRTLIGMLWTKLMAKIVRRWIDSRLIGIALLIISSILLVQPKGQLANYFGLAAIVAALATLLTSMALLHKYQESPNDNAAAGLTTIVEMEHDTYGFQPAAIWWSVPRALSIYSVALFTLEIIAMVLESCGVPFAIAAITVIGLLSLGTFTMAMHYTIKAVSQWVRNRRVKEESAA